jgi:hypothetical protein
MDSLNPVGAVDQSSAAAGLAAFRGRVYRCPGRRRDELFELTDALLRAEGPVRSPGGCVWCPSIVVGTAPRTTR